VEEEVAVREAECRDAQNKPSTACWRAGSVGIFVAQFEQGRSGRTCFGSFTFKHHLDVVLRLLEQAGAASAMVVAIRGTSNVCLSK
jgi:hypothetical protein